MDKKKELGLEKISETKEKLMSWACAEIDCGMANANIEKLGEVVDMIKDLAEAEMHCVEAEEKKMKKKYYCSLIGMMHDWSEEEDGDMDEELEKFMMMRMGYNANRYASGRYAPAGHGNSTAGYSMMGGRSVTGGATDGMAGNVRSSNRMGYPMIPPKHGESWGEHGMEPWYYHDGSEFDEHMTQEDRMRNAVENLEKMWKHADPQLRREMKGDLSKLLNDVPV